MPCIALVGQIQQAQQEVASYVKINLKIIYKRIHLLRTPKIKSQFNFRGSIIQLYSMLPIILFSKVSWR